MDTPNRIILDLTDCKYIDEFHHRIMQAFDFPSWYGANWDAFWDLIDGLRDNTIVEIHGVSSLSAALKGEVKKMTAYFTGKQGRDEKAKRTPPKF